MSSGWALSRVLVNTDTQSLGEQVPAHGEAHDTSANPGGEEGGEDTHAKEHYRMSDLGVMPGVSSRHGGVYFFGAIVSSSFTDLTPSTCFARLTARARPAAEATVPVSVTT